MKATPDDSDLTDKQIAERMERSLRRAFQKPHQPHGKNPTTPPTPKVKTRPASKGRVHKGKTGR